MESDEALVKRVLGGETAAYGELVSRYERMAFAMAVGILRDRQIAEDAAQESFLAAYEGLGRLERPGAFGPWMMTIVRRQALRMSARKLQIAGPEHVEARAALETVDVDKERLMSAVMRLPEGERQVVIWRHFDGQDAPTMARMLGESIGTVSKRLARGHARLREMLKEYRT